MNKTLIVLLAVCLISAHAFVKRDAPEAVTEENTIEQFGKQVGNVFQEIKNQVSTSLDPENIKKGFNDVVDSVNKAINNMKPKDGKA